jgi:hypothetical protein
MTTARDIIKKALQKNGVLVMSEAPSADEASDGLFALNSMISSWSNDSLTVYARTWETFNNAITSGNSSYTIGVGGSINTVRPNNIVEAYVRLAGQDYELTIVDDEYYNSISNKTLSGIPAFINFDNAYPLATLRLWPSPQSTYTLGLVSEKPFTEFSTLDTAVSLPSGWEKALIDNLAIELAPEYGQEPSPSLARAAAKSLGSIKTAAAKVRGMDANIRTGVRFNIYSGTYV